MTRSRSITFLAGAAIALAVPAVAAFGNGASASTAAARTMNGRTATVSAAKPTLNVRSTRLGKTLADSRGRTLYLFKRDSRAKSACSGACAAAWPPLRASGKPTVGSGAKASMVATIKRSDGKPQVTYRGHPLYRFSGDHNPNDTNGQGLNAFGGHWWVLSAAGNQITSRPSTAGGGTTY